MRGRYRIFWVALCLSMGGCFWPPPEIPPEIAAILADPGFSEAADVTHQGNLDDLEGCWGSFRVNDGSTDVVFRQFADPGFRTVIYVTWPWPGVIVEDGVYDEFGDGKTIVVTTTSIQTSIPETGELEAHAIPDEGYTTSYEVCVDGDKMTIWNPGVDAEQYDGTFWRFDVCP